MQLQYRPATLADLEEIWNLVSAAVDTMIKQNIFQWDELYPTEEDLREDIEKGTLSIGVADEKIAVIYVLNQEYDEEYQKGDWAYQGESFYIIHRLCVNPSFQHKGIAKKTLRHIEKELQSVGVCAVRLDVFSQNPYALKLYESAGYQKTGHADWRKGRFYLMEKLLAKQVD